MIYLDHAATTPVPAVVADAMYDVLRHQFGNPSAQYPYGRESAALVDRCRRRRGARARLPPGAAVFHLLRHGVRQLGHLRGRVAGPPRRAAHHHHRP